MNLIFDSKLKWFLMVFPHWYQEPWAILSSATLWTLVHLVCNRFYSALVLWALLHETPTPLLLKKFALSKGQLQQLQQSAASYTHTVGVPWKSVVAMSAIFQGRWGLSVRRMWWLWCIYHNAGSLCVTFVGWFFMHRVEIWRKSRQKMMQEEETKIN